MKTKDNSACTYTYTLIKRGPSGKITQHDFKNEEELKDHLISMWQYAEGYNIISIFLKPSSSESL